MSVNVAIIFLALLIGVIIGHTIGVRRVTQKVSEMLNTISSEIIKATEADKKKKEEHMTKMMKMIIESAKSSKKENNDEECTKACD